MTGIRLPRPDEYQVAIQSPRTAFNDPDLRASQVETTPLGLPDVRSGGFALIYRLSGASGVWAVRCFHKAVPDLQERYAAIVRFLEQHPNGHFTRTTYLADGIRVRTERYPVTKMAWIDGDALNLFVEESIGRPQEIRPLAGKLVALVQHLESLGVAHGDLQHGNILVRDGDLKLIDYDGMFVPALAGRRSNELGHPNYQHPARTDADFNAQLDRFSAIVIYIALTAISVKPSLWTTYGVGGENLLFQQKDFANPGGSRLFGDLDAIPELRRMVAGLRWICASPPAATPRLVDFISGTWQQTPVAPSTQVALPIVIRRPYPVLSATAVTTLREKIGDRIEVVGRITHVHRGFTRFYAPYVFVNFGDWRSGCFTLVIWSKALDLFRKANIDVEWYIGRWVSVTGLITSFRERPQVIINMPSEIEILATEREAQERLAFARPAYTAASPVAPIPGGARPPTQGPISPPRSATTSQVDRDQILDDLYKNYPTKSSPPTTPREPTAPGTGPAQRSTPPPSPPVPARPASTAPQPSQQSRQPGPAAPAPAKPRPQAKKAKSLWERLLGALR